MAWSPGREWWMDLLKYVITFILGATATVLVLDRIEENRINKRTQIQATYQLRLNALNDFRLYTLAYNDAALDAYVDLYTWHDRNNKTPAMSKYEHEAQSNYRAAIDQVRDRFANIPDVIKLLTELDTNNQKRHERTYDQLVDSMIDYGERPDAEAHRDEFSDYQDKFMKNRQRIISMLESFLLQDERS